MNTKITYLLGAGASANSIPPVKDLNNEIISFLQNLDNLKLFKKNFESHLDIKFTVSEIKSKMLKECFALMTEAQGHLTIDTFARKLFLTRRNSELRQLKALISLFLINEQFKKEVDLRYDAFFATLFEHGQIFPTLPKSINIITWNYDFQLEKAAAPYLQLKNIEEIQRELNVFPSSLSGLDFNRFSIIKFNGTAAGWEINNKYRGFGFDLIEANKYSFSNENMWESYLSNYHYNTLSFNQTTFALKFAWEKDVYIDNIRNNAKQALIDTSHLVIIGYSFPTFNRKMDKEILNSIGKLKKVTIQTLDENIDEINYRFRSLFGTERLNEIEIELIRMKSKFEEFYIPFEYTGV